MSKRRKPVLSLASAMHRISPAAVALMPAAPAPAAAAAPAGAGAVTTDAAPVTSKKRKRAAQLISAFHVLQREQDALAAKKGSMAPSAYAVQHALLESRIAALGGLSTYQSLSIAGHSNSKYAAFNTSHWVMDVLASYPEFANLRPFAGRGRRAASGTTEGEAAAAAAAEGSSSVDRKMARRQKEREKKRARKKQKKAEEAAAAAAAAAAAGAGKKGGAAAASSSNKKGAKQPAKPQSEDEEEEEAEDPAEDDEEDEERSGDGGATASSSSAVSPSAPLFSSSRRVRLLDVGSLTNHYLAYSSQVDCLAIDLEPAHPSVLKKDFFELDVGELAGQFDAVVLSLVLNFVGDRFQRGEMIKRAVRMLRRDGVGRLFVILPSACLLNSRWMNQQTFVERCMAPLGMRLGKWKYSTKLAFFEFVREEVQEEEEEEEEEQEQEQEAPPAEEAEEQEAEGAEEGDTIAAALAAKKKAAAAAAAAGLAKKKKKKKGFQPAGIVLEGETRNNFSIAWRAD